MGEEKEEEEAKPAQRGRKVAVEKVEEKKPAAKGRRKKVVEKEEISPASSPIKPRGRAAAKKASDKTKAAIDDMSNLNKKKRRPSSKTPVKAQKRKVEETGQVEETTKKTRSRRN